MDHHSGLWCARRPFCVMHAVSKITFVSNPGDTKQHQKASCKMKRAMEGRNLTAVIFRGKKKLFWSLSEVLVSKTRIQIQCRFTLSPLWLGALWVVWCHRRSCIFLVDFSPPPFSWRWPCSLTQPSEWPRPVIMAPAAPEVWFLHFSCNRLPV